VTSEPAPDEFVWWSGLRWVDAANMQIWRLEEAFYEEARAVADAETRRDHHDDPKRYQQWRVFLDDMDPYDSQRPLRVPSWSLHMQVANELDLLIVAIRNVLRAQDRIPKEVRPEMGRQDVLELLRNVSEHWDEIGGRSADTLATDHPDIAIGGIAYTGKEIWIGGDRGVPLSRITAWLWRVWRALIACLADAGIEVPEDLSASRFEGDDDLSWPAERLHFHWSLPRVEEKDWPREPVPEGMLEALAVLFANRRTRDPLD
jgi:hypothetical protein